MFRTGLFTSRARKSKLKTWRADDAGRSFLGSADFPPSLVATALKRDPKGILFGTDEIANPGSADRAEQTRLRGILDDTLRGKRILCCSGADDRLVPHRCSEDLLDFLRTACLTWYRDGDVALDDRVYAGVGHAFAPPMVEDAVRFLTDAVAEFHAEALERRSQRESTGASLESKM